MSKRNVSVQIDKLIVHGLPRAQARALALGIERELGSLLSSESAFAEGRSQDRNLVRVTRGGSNLESLHGTRSTAMSVARAVVRGVTDQGKTT